LHHQTDARTNVGDFDGRAEFESWPPPKPRPSLSEFRKHIVNSNSPNSPTAFDVVWLTNELNQLDCSLEYFEQLDSTNDWARENTMVMSRQQLPCLVLANEQTNGRGRDSNKWLSSAGSLTCSFVFDNLETALMGKRPIRSLAFGMAVCQCIQDSAIDQLGIHGDLPNVRLKWPNDVLIDGKKAAGMLIESIPRLPNRLTVGVGVNINNKINNESETKNFRVPATSMADSTESEYCLNRFLVRLVSELKEVAVLPCEEISQRVQSGFGDWDALKGSKVQMDTAQGSVSGIADGLAANGSMLVRVDSGETLKIASASNVVQL